MRAGDRTLKASFDHRQYNDVRMSSVQFIRWDLGELAADDVERLAEAGELEIVIDHPEMQLAQPFPARVAAALVEDMRTP